jgi:hypothetical protein
VLERTIQARAVAKINSQSAKTQQKPQWKEEPETDTPQAEARQPYRSRENDSADASRNSTEKQGKAKKDPDEKGSE